VKEILEQIALESERARKQWGTTFDDKNTLNDWAVYVNIYLGKATAMGATKEEVVKNLIKAAGLLVSALDRAVNDKFAPRHYEGQPRPTSLPEINSGGK
jgi:hypothetical protein